MGWHCTLIEENRASSIEENHGAGSAAAAAAVRRVLFAVHFAERDRLQHQMMMYPLEQTEAANGESPIPMEPANPGKTKSARHRLLFGGNKILPRYISLVAVAKKDSFTVQLLTLSFCSLPFHSLSIFDLNSSALCDAGHLPPAPFIVSDFILEKRFVVHDFVTFD